ncbi:hypothetical protein Mapa_015580 [Marchantia paleacea]|nr:hypothetical protein Mapa_015580 [Marchantia paleacea]
MGWASKDSANQAQKFQKAGLISRNNFFILKSNCRLPPPSRGVLSTNLHELKPAGETIMDYLRPAQRHYLDPCRWLPLRPITVQLETLGLGRTLLMLLTLPKFPSTSGPTG